MFATAGTFECEWLLEEYRDTVATDVKAMMVKAEADLVRMSRTVLIHSRLFNQPSLAGTGGAAGDEPLEAGWS